MTPETRAAIRKGFRKDLPAILEGRDEHNERHCSRCGMNFRVGFANGHGTKHRVAWTTCAEPGCEVLFWSVMINYLNASNYGAKPGTAVCGVAP